VTLVLLFLDMHNHINYSPGIWYLWAFIFDVAVIGGAR